MAGPRSFCFVTLLRKQVACTANAHFAANPKTASKRRRAGAQIFSAIIAITGLSPLNCSAAPIEWPVSAGGNGHYYEYVSTSVQWPVAKANAENTSFNGVRGHLATIKSSAENAFLTSRFPKAWAGLTDSESFGGSEGNFKWVTGEPLSYTNWYPGEPNDVNGNEDFMEVNFSNGRWNDAFNGYSQGYIIEYERRFDISFTTFIAGNYITAPWFHPDASCVVGEDIRYRVFNGNDRPTLANPSGPDAYKSRQTVSVVPAAYADADGMIAGSKSNLVGRTKSFASNAMADGRLTAADEDSVLLDCDLLHNVGFANPGGMAIDDPVRLFNDQISVRLSSNDNGPSDPLVTHAPSIDWDIVITLDVDGNYVVTGDWDGFPSAELYINDTLVYLYDAGVGPYDLLASAKLWPGYGDEPITRTGRITRSPRVGAGGSQGSVPEPSCMCQVVIAALAGHRIFRARMNTQH